MKKRANKKLVYVAMSGGVDSSVAAALLKNLPAGRQGEKFDVVGVFMKPWSPESVSSIKYPVLSIENKNHKILNTKYVIPNTASCMWQKDREDAMKVAAKLGIPLLTWDFSKEYKKHVTDYMIREYRAGRTPNPDVMCNKHIKFGLFLEKALKEGADYIATGHYVVKRETRNLKRNSRDTRYTLHVARDANKDQSYFLWTLTQNQLKYCLFPIGNYIKPEVRKLAKKFGLTTAEKKDSQGVCFVGPLDVKEFLKLRIKPKRGRILDLNGNLIGHHDGVFYYTIGQRHGLDIKNGEGPHYIVAKDVKKNIIFVGGKNYLKNREIQVTDTNWINDDVKISAKISVKIRYRSKSIPVIISSVSSTNSTLHAPRSMFYAVTPGQSAVFYRGKELLGGGIIE